MSEREQLARKIEHSDKWFRITLLATCVVLVLLSVLTLAKVLQVNSQLQAQVEESRKNTQRAVEEIKKENESKHNEQDRFLKCVFLIAINERTEAIIDGCMDKARQTSTTPYPDNSAPVQGTSVNNATPAVIPATAEGQTDEVKQPEDVTPPEPEVTNRLNEILNTLPTVTDSPLTKPIERIINGNSNKMVL